MVYWIARPQRPGAGIRLREGVTPRLDHHSIERWACGKGQAWDFIRRGPVAIPGANPLHRDHLGAGCLLGRRPPVPVLDRLQAFLFLPIGIQDQGSGPGSLIGFGHERPSNPQLGNGVECRAFHIGSIHIL